MLIADACTIILLAKASVLEKASETYNLQITQEVHQEVMAGKEKLFVDALLVERLINEHKIKVVKVIYGIMKKIEQDFKMGLGEASTVAFALDAKEGIIATDNKQGRKAAMVYSLPLIGSIEIITDLYYRKRIDKAKALNSIQILQEKGWFNVSLIEKARGEIS